MLVIALGVCLGLLLFVGITKLFPWLCMVAFAWWFSGFLADKLGVAQNWFYYPLLALIACLALLEKFLPKIQAWIDAKNQPTP